MRNKKKYIYNKENKRVTKDWRSENGHTLRERERKQLLCKKKEESLYNTNLHINKI